jgi:hypothetical protein
MAGWGNNKLESMGQSEDFEVEEDAKGGAHLSAYYVQSPNLHIGGFFTYNKGDSKLKHDDLNYEAEQETELIGVGISAKFGAPFGSRIWFGGVLDVGYANPFWEDDNEEGAWNGVYLSARLNLDLLGFQVGAVKVGANIGFGVEAVPYGKGKTDLEGGEGVDSEVWAARLQLVLGLIIGS